MQPPDNLLSPEAVTDPHGFLRRLREHDPVFWSPRHKVWILTAHADVGRLLLDRSLSTAQGIGSFRQRLGAQHAGLLHHAMSLLDGWMLFRDPPEPTRLRDPVRRAGAGMADTTTSANWVVVSMGRAATMAAAMRRAKRSSPYRWKSSLRCPFAAS